MNRAFDPTSTTSLQAMINNKSTEDTYVSTTTLGVESMALENAQGITSRMTKAAVGNETTTAEVMKAKRIKESKTLNGSREQLIAI